MARVTVEDCLDNVDNLFQLVLLASARARRLANGAEPTVPIDNDKVTVIAVHIGARIAALAGAGDVLVSRTVKDLVAGSGIDFEDRGQQELKGVPGTWELYAVSGAGAAP